jgi:hypothetical protein
MQHLDQARKAGWSEAEIAQIEGDGPKAALGPFPDILDFVDECVAEVRASNATFAKLADILSRRCSAQPRSPAAPTTPRPRSPTTRRHRNPRAWKPSRPSRCRS